MQHKPPGESGIPGTTGQRLEYGAIALGAVALGAMLGGAIAPTRNGWYAGKGPWIGGALAGLLAYNLMEAEK